MKILLATDGSAYSEGAAKFLACLDWRPDDELTVFHAVSWVPFVYDRESYLETLKEIKKDIAPRILNSAVEILTPVKAKLSTAIIDGAAEYYIVDTSVAAGIDLIVMGARGVKGISSIFIGSVTKSVASHSPKPVLVTKLPVCSRAGKMKVLFATDGSEHSLAAAKLLTQLPFPGSSELTILNVVWSDFSDIPERFALEINDRIKDTVAETRSAELKESERIVEQARESLAGKFGAIQTLMKIADPSTEILKTAKELKSDLIVVGCRGLRGIKGMLGSVSRNVLTHSTCAVLLVK